MPASSGASRNDWSNCSSRSKAVEARVTRCPVSGVANSSVALRTAKISGNRPTRCWPISGSLPSAGRSEARSISRCRTAVRSGKKRRSTSRCSDCSQRREEQAEQQRRAGDHPDRVAGAADEVREERAAGAEGAVEEQQQGRGERAVEEAAADHQLDVEELVAVDRHEDRDRVGQHQQRPVAEPLPARQSGDIERRADQHRADPRQDAEEHQSSLLSSARFRGGQHRAAEQRRHRHRPEREADLVQQGLSLFPAPRQQLVAEALEELRAADTDPEGEPDDIVEADQPGSPPHPVGSLGQDRGEVELETELHAVDQLRQDSARQRERGLPINPRGARTRRRRRARRAAAGWRARRPRSGARRGRRGRDRPRE